MDDPDDWDLELLDKIILRAEEENKSKRGATTPQQLPSGDKKAPTNGFPSNGFPSKGYLAKTVQRDSKATVCQDGRFGPLQQTRSGFSSMERSIHGNVFPQNPSARPAPSYNREYNMEFNRVGTPPQLSPNVSVPNRGNQMQNTSAGPMAYQQQQQSLNAGERRIGRTALSSERVVVDQREKVVSPSTNQMRQPSPQGHGITQGPQGHGISQGPQGHGITHSPQGHGITHSPQGHGITHSPQSHGITHSPQGHGITHGTPWHEGNGKVTNPADHGMNGFMKNGWSKEEKQKSTIVDEATLLRNELRMVRGTLAERDGALSSLRSRLAKADLELKGKRQSTEGIGSTEEFKRKVADLQREVERLNSQLSFKEEEVRQNQRFRTDMEEEVKDLMVSKASLQAQINDLEKQRFAVASSSSLQNGTDGTNNKNTLPGQSKDFREKDNQRGYSEHTKMASTAGNQFRSRQRSTSTSPPLNNIWSPPFLPEGSQIGIKPSDTGVDSQLPENLPLIGNNIETVPVLREPLAGNQEVLEREENVKNDIQDSDEVPSGNHAATQDLSVQGTAPESAGVPSPPTTNNPTFPPQGNEEPTVPEPMETDEVFKIKNSFVEVQNALRHIWEPRGAKAEGNAFVAKIFAFCSKEIRNILTISKGGPSFDTKERERNGTSGRPSKRGEEAGRASSFAKGAQGRWREEDINILNGRRSNEMDQSNQLHEVLTSVMNGLLPTTAILEPLLELCKCEENSTSAAVILRFVLQNNTRCRNAFLQGEDTDFQKLACHQPEDNLNLSLPRFSTRVICEPPIQQYGELIENSVIGKTKEEDVKNKENQKVRAQILIGESSKTERVYSMRGEMDVENSVVQKGGLKEKNSMETSRERERRECEELSRERGTAEVMKSAVKLGGLLERIVELVLKYQGRKKVQETSLRILRLLLTHLDARKASQLLRILIREKVLVKHLNDSQSPNLQREALGLILFLLQFERKNISSSVWEERESQKAVGTAGKGEISEKMEVLGRVMDCLDSSGHFVEDTRVRLEAIRIISYVAVSGDMLTKAFMGIIEERSSLSDSVGRDGHQISSENGGIPLETTNLERSSGGEKNTEREKLGIKLVKLIDKEQCMESTQVDGGNVCRNHTLREAIIALSHLSSDSENASKFWSDIQTDRKLLFLCVDVSNRVLGRLEQNIYDYKTSNNLMQMIRNFKYSALSHL